MRRGGQKAEGKGCEEQRKEKEGEAISPIRSRVVDCFRIWRRRDLDPGKKDEERKDPECPFRKGCTEKVA